MHEDRHRTGGCQCGRIRFRTRGPLGRPVICHCRMCQKQFGSMFSILVAVKGEVVWLRDEPAYFQSSNVASRGFCAYCGTPLTFRTDDGIELSVGAFDDRSDLIPQIQVNCAQREIWVDRMLDAPSRDPETDAKNQEGILSLQHPDHDT